MGGSIQWDTRDNRFYPSRGCYHQFSAYWLDEAFGSDFNFTRYRLDLRRFFPLDHRSVLAFRAYLDSNNGVPPVLLMPKLGGDEGRGYYEGRYIDKTMLSLNGEYRVKVWKRIGAVAFSGLTDVAHNLDDFDIKNLKYFFGGGVRFLVNKEENINIRLDIGFTENGSNFYFGALEVF